MTETVRPTKKQRDILTYIEQFISEHGYSPSYREIMNGLNYTSVATVSLHVNSLIRRGHLRKRDRSARSLEITASAATTADTSDFASSDIKPGEEKWLVSKVENLVQQAEQAESLSETDLHNLSTLIQALRVLGLDGAASSFSPRLANVRLKPVNADVAVATVGVADAPTT